MRSKQRPGPKTAKLNPRACAAQIVASVFNGRSLTESLQATPCAGLQAPFIQALCYGLLREYPRQGLILERLLEKPLKPQDADIQALLLAGLYQLDAMKAPPHAVVNESVQACRTLGKDWASALVNAILRRYLREAQTLKHQQANNAEYRHAMPNWLLERLQQDWPQDWRAICAASELQAPLSLRVNLSKTGRDDYLGLLNAEGLSAQPHPWVDSALVLDQAVAVEQLPGFLQGLVSVQDAGAQLAAALLDPGPGQLVLDACAAPGGKTGHLLEWANNTLELTAVDKDPQRLARVNENLSRLGLEARCLVADITESIAETSEQPWTQARYHRILLDAPCSATGVIRRHPDIKLLRRESDIAALSRIQAQALRSLWPLLRPGGRLLYATCSLLSAENQDIISDFLTTDASVREVKIDADWGHALIHGRQILPGAHHRHANSDGFFYALLEKIP